MFQNDTVFFSVGRNCAEYNFGGFRIQRNGNMMCTDCPMAYASTESFKCKNNYKHVPILVQVLIFNILQN